MQPLNWLAIGAVLLLAAIMTFAPHPRMSAVPPIPKGFSTLGAVTNVTLPAFKIPNQVASSTAPTTTPAAPVKKPVALPQATTTPTPAPAALAAAPAVSTQSLNQTVGLVRGALVNIICVPKATNLKSASATGVVIDPRGIIMTVAHMGQFFLLKDYPRRDNTTCVIRIGSPAKTTYSAALIFISPDWIKNNPSTLIQAVPTGTGENDFAFLAITGSVSGDAISNLPAIPLSKEDPPMNEAVTIGSYGAEFLDAAEIRTALYPIVVFGSITDRFTFHASTEDLISVTNTAAAQEGSSGGVVVNDKDEAIGLITTSSLSTGGVTTRSLHAITPNYIRRDFRAETGKDLDTFLLSDRPTALAKKFENDAAGLSSLLEGYLN